jgi:hypothetical protein
MFPNFKQLKTTSCRINARIFHNGKDFSQQGAEKHEDYLQAIAEFKTICVHIDTDAYKIFGFRKFYPNQLSYPLNAQTLL